MFKALQLTLLSLILYIVTFSSAVELTAYSNKCYQCVQNNTAGTSLGTLTSYGYCGGLNKCYSTQTELNKNCTYNATDFMRCPTQAVCSTNTKQADWIIIDNLTDGTKNFSYEIQPNQRCQFFIVNALVDEVANATFYVQQENKATNVTTSTTTTTNSTIKTNTTTNSTTNTTSNTTTSNSTSTTNSTTSTIVIKALRFFVGNTLNDNLTLVNDSTYLRSLTQMNQVILTNGNFTYLVVVNESPDLKLSYLVYYSSAHYYYGLLMMIVIIFCYV